MEVDSIEFEKHLSELSSDFYLGRKPFTLGEIRTLDYLEKTLRGYGLEPAVNGSFRQEVPMVEIDGIASEQMQIWIDDMGMALNLREDFVAATERPVDHVEIENSPLVFCGYGIVAPEYDWNDFEGVDMKGKTAVVLVNDPGLGGEDPSFFKANTMTYYGRWTYKYEEADRQGLDGVILIHETHMAGYPWFVVQSGWTGPQLYLDQDRKGSDCAIKGWIHLEKAKELFTACGFDLSDMIKSAKKPGFKPVEMGAKVSVGVTNKLKRDKSYNIVAKKSGVKRPEEHIVYTAHWDHLGIGAAVDGDSIYNGALDNASGTSTLLSIAKAFANGPDCDRTAVFSFVTGEEQGLLGSEWYSEEPAMPLEDAICNINIDGINLIGSASDLTITGYGQSNLDEIAESFATKNGRYVQGEQEPEKGYFFRSDHFNFAKNGIPALYAKGGYEHREKGKEYARSKRADFISNDYHRPSDEYNADTWNLTGALEDAQLLLDAGQYLLNSNIWPEWKEGSEFKSLDKRNKFLKK
jgi:Zn-dependent M28 family amino/carboxypeptidase